MSDDLERMYRREEAMDKLKTAGLCVGGATAFWFVGLPLLGFLFGPILFLVKLGLIGAAGAGCYALYKKWFSEPVD
jgi:hypothetical protein